MPGKTVLATRPVSIETDSGPVFSNAIIQQSENRRLWIAPFMSLLVPGSGQTLLGQQRGVAYLVAEAYLVLQAVRAQKDATKEREAYRELALTVARSSFSGAKPEGNWDYYERMQYDLESGAFNMTPGDGFTPESNLDTYNGSIWMLARRTYWRNPDIAPDISSAEYNRALEFYKSRAANDDFLWSWRDAQLEQDLYKQTIDRSNEASRRARQMVGLLLANHALSLVDAYVSVRLRVFGQNSVEGNGSVGVSASMPFPDLLR